MEAVIAQGIRNDSREMYALSLIKDLAERKAAARKVIRRRAIGVGIRLTNVQIYHAVRMVLYIR